MGEFCSLPRRDGAAWGFRTCGCRRAGRAPTPKRATRRRVGREMRPFTGSDRTRGSAAAVLLALAALITCREPAGPDATGRIAFQRGGGSDAKLYVMRSDGSDVHQLRQSGDEESYAAWSPDGAEIAYRRIIDTLGAPFVVVGIYRMSADGSRIARVFLADNCSDSPCHPIGDQIQPTWSPDGA